ncbi:MAG TPA: sigma-70 family RNA polymerase sigma factor [Actinomycetes bacterium]|nr:sigma-70 family RNA polymerase sigma factor [Actinomycetes bacterium]
MIELTLATDVNLTRSQAATGSDNGEKLMPEMTLDQLLPAYRDSLVRFAESYAHRSSEAEDVVQDVFVRIIRAEAARPDGAGLRRYDRPGAYLRRAVANESVSHWRRASRERPTAELPERAGADHADRVTDRIVVRDAVAELPERMRQVVTLSFLEGMSDAAVAAALGITEITVRTTRKRALGHLRLALADLGAERATAAVPVAAPVQAPALVPAQPTVPTPSSAQVPSTLAA